MKTLEKVYRELAIERGGMTEREFSAEWLGKTGSYMAYLKSTKRDASADCLLKLFGKLSKEKSLCEQELRRANTDFRKAMLLDWIGLYDKLRSDVYTDMTYGY